MKVYVVEKPVFLLLLEKLFVRTLKKMIESNGVMPTYRFFPFARFNFYLHCVGCILEAENSAAIFKLKTERTVQK